MTEIVVSIISAVAVIVGAVLTFVIQLKKLRADNEELQITTSKELADRFSSEIANVRQSLDVSKELYLAEISNVNGAISDMKASNQQFQAIMDLRLEHMTGEFNDMKTEVREHNNFARRLPVLEEKMKVTEHRLEDLEKQ